MRTLCNFPSEQELEALEAVHEKGCVTIYVPSYDPSEAALHTRIELKNLLHEADMALGAAGIQEATRRKILRPAKELLEDNEFWIDHRGSLVLFMRLHNFRYYHVPVHDIPRIVSVSDSFLTEPLREAMKANVHYFVLTLGHKKIRLFEGDRYSMKRVELEDFPTDMKTALNIDEYPNWRELHAIAPASKGRRSEGYHSQYDVSNTDKKMLLTFFRKIDHRLHAYLKGKDEPLVLAGVHYLHPMYLHTNTYAHTLKEGIYGNFDREPLDSIRQKALQLL